MLRFSLFACVARKTKRKSNFQFFFSQVWTSSITSVFSVYRNRFITAAAADRSRSNHFSRKKSLTATTTAKCVWIKIHSKYLVSCFTARQKNIYSLVSLYSYFVIATREKSFLQWRWCYQSFFGCWQIYRFFFFFRKFSFTISDWLVFTQTHRQQNPRQNPHTENPQQNSHTHTHTHWLGGHNLISTKLNFENENWKQKIQFSFLACFVFVIAESVFVCLFPSLYFFFFLVFGNYFSLEVLGIKISLFSSKNGLFFSRLLLRLSIDWSIDLSIFFLSVVGWLLLEVFFSSSKSIIIICCCGYCWQQQQQQQQKGNIVVIISTTAKWSNVWFGLTFCCCCWQSTLLWRKMKNSNNNNNNNKRKENDFRKPYLCFSFTYY